MKIKRVVLIAVITTLLIPVAATLALQTPQERAESYYKQGYLYYLEKDNNAAIAEYDKAISLKPDMAKAYYWKAKSYYTLKEYGLAKQNIAKALSITPDIYDGPAFQKKIEAANTPKAPPAKIEPVQAPTTPLVKPVPEAPKEPAEVRISMDLRAVEVSHAFRLLAKETGQNIVIDSNVTGRITVTLNNVSTKEAFDAILRAGNCKAIEEGNVIRIVTSGEPNRTQILPGGIINKTFPLNYIQPDDISPTLSSLLPDGTKVVTTKSSNSIMIEGFEDAINKAETIIANLDTAPEQVMVEARIVELSHSNSSVLGVNFKAVDPANVGNVVQTKGLAGPPTASTATGLYYTVTNRDMESLLEALQTKTGYNLLSSPKVMALNGKQAEIITGQRLGYKVKTITDTGLIESVEFLDVGTKLVFTPFIKSNGMIVMEIHPEISEGSIVNDLPQKKSTETTTQLIVRDGETIIIGGLMKDATQKVNKGVPFLSEIPLIGVPFRRVELITEQREVMVLISPKIVSADMKAKMLPEAEKFEKKWTDEHYESPLDLVR